MAITGYTNKQVSQITGVTARQLTYWRKTGFIVPSAHTWGGHARYSFTDLIAIKATRQLIDAGVSVQRIRKNIDSLIRFLPDMEQPLAEVSVVATGDVLLVLHKGAAIEALTGQEWILEIARFQNDIQKILQGEAQSVPVQQELFEQEVNDFMQDMG